ncbi:17962_t:CDS:2, partial [Dentiscutata erythropus]
KFQIANNSQVLERTIFNSLINDLEYVLEEDVESIGLTNESLIFDDIEAESINKDELDYNIEINPFLFDKISFERARALAKADENSDTIFLNNVSDNSDELTSSEFNLESTTSNSSLKLGHIDLTNLEHKHEVNSETAIAFGKALGNAT